MSFAQPVLNVKLSKPKQAKITALPAPKFDSARTTI